MFLIVLVSGSWCVWRVRCSVKVKFLSSMKPRPRWTWKLMSSFNRRYGESLLTALSSQLLTGSILSWTIRGNDFIVERWLSGTSKYAKVLILSVKCFMLDLRLLYLIFALFSSHVSEIKSSVESCLELLYTETRFFGKTNGNYSVRHKPTIGTNSS